VPLPASPALSFVMTCTGIDSTSDRKRPFATKDCMNIGPISLARILGEMPPARIQPLPVAIQLEGKVSGLRAVDCDP